jgi:hypothetical protein
VKLDLFYLSIIFCLLAAGSCHYFRKKESEKPVARVSELFLYPSDLKDQIPNGVSVNDSVRIVRRLIEDWVRDKLLLKKAELYISGSDFNIEKQVEDYRASLLTYKYKQEMLEQKLDTVIPEREIRKYYQENSSNYILNADVVKLTYIKIPLNAPNIQIIRKLYKSEKDEDLANLEQYCNAYAESFIIKSQNWYRFADFIQNTPFKTTNPGRFLIYNKNIETSDSVNHYFIHIFEHIPERKTAPLEMVCNDIRSVLLNKRKITLLQEMESAIYKEGLSRNLAEIYK